MDILDTNEIVQYLPKVVVLASFLLLSTVYTFFRRSSEKNKPRDPKLPPLCTSKTYQDVGKMFTSTNGPREFLMLSREMGVSDYQVPLFPLAPPLYVLTDYRSARKVLEDADNTKWSPGNLFFDRTTHNGPNMITAEGHRWKHVRKSTSTAFSSQNVKLMVEQIDVIVDAWIEKTLKPSMEGKKPIPVLDEMNKITANVIAKVAFDYDITDEERDQFLYNLNICWEEFGVKAQGAITKQLPVTAWVYPGIQKGKKAAKRMYKFCEKMAKAYRAKDDKDKKPHKLIHMILEDAEYENDGERIRDMIGYTVAGFDTTANTLGFALLELAKNPSEQRKLRSALQKYSTTDEARSCPELRLITRETLRMYPAAALGTFRLLGKDLELPATKQVIPKGSLVNNNYYAIQHNPELFEDPDSFKPSRWENPTKEQTMSLLTFSYGKRNCQGQALANAEMNEILCKLCSAFEFTVVEEGEAQNVVLYKPVGTLLSASPAT